jgi:C1A family cysteine protease
MRSILALSLLGAVSMAEETAEFEFMNFIAKFNKNYNNMEEYATRFAVWKKMDDFVRKVNAPGSEYTHTAAHNHMSDYHHHELMAMMGTVENLDRPVYVEHETIQANRTEMDWRTENGGACINPVKNQGSCGSCWAFSSCATLESSYCLDGNDLYSFSEQ